jgi:hypothetical protein
VAVTPLSKITTFQVAAVFEKNINTKKSIHNNSEIISKLSKALVRSISKSVISTMEVLRRNYTT